MVKDRPKILKNIQIVRKTSMPQITLFKLICANIKINLYHMELEGFLNPWNNLFINLSASNLSNGLGGRNFNLCDMR